MKKAILLISIISILLGACMQSNDGEKQTKYIENLHKLAKKYPSFKTKINEQIAKYQKAYDEAQNMSDQVKKHDKLELANHLLTEGCVGKLQNSNSIIDSIKTNIKTLNSISEGMSEADLRYATIVIKDAEEAIADLEKIMSITEVKSEDAQCMEFEKIYAKLEIRLDDLRMAIKNLRDAKKYSEEEGNEEKMASNEETVNEEVQMSSSEIKMQAGHVLQEKIEPKVELTKCEYCGKENNINEKKCSCGADVKK